jgi:hypothetical protein
MMAELMPGRIAPDDAAARIARIAEVLPAATERIGGWQEQLDYDLSVAQWIRRNGALFAVLGAGVTIDAGGPSWAELVKWLLEIALERGNEIRVYEATERGARARVDRVERLSVAEESQAKQILARIEDESADTELLMRGGQICADLFKESLFQKITALLYPGRNVKPSSIHRAIAALAHWQKVPGLGVTAGWASIISYNFDSLMTAALESERVPYTVRLMRNRQVHRFDLEGDPLPDRSLPVIHLHGYTPQRPFFDLRGINFVFSMRQFEEMYEDKEETIASYALHHYISHPAYVGLYVGCSFNDEAMNSHLRHAARRFPGRVHYALLRLPKEFREGGDEGIVQRETSHYLTMGVRPIWFTDFDEIPGLIARLA